MKIEVFQLVKHDVLSDEEGLGEEEEEEGEGLELEDEPGIGGILNSEQEWL